MNSCIFVFQESLWSCFQKNGRKDQKRDCFPDEVPYGFPEFLRKEIQLNEESYIKNDFTKESEELKFKETLYRLYGEGEQSERN